MHCIRKIRMTQVHFLQKIGVADTYPITRRVTNYLMMYVPISTRSHDWHHIIPDLTQRGSFWDQISTRCTISTLTVAEPRKFSMWNQECIKRSFAQNSIWVFISQKKISAQSASDTKILQKKKSEIVRWLQCPHSKENRARSEKAIDTDEAAADKAVACNHSYCWLTTECSFHTLQQCLVIVLYQEIKSVQHHCLWSSNSWWLLLCMERNTWRAWF